MLKQAGKPLNVNAISYAHCRTKKFVNWVFCHVRAFPALFQYIRICKFYCNNILYHAHILRVYIYKLCKMNVGIEKF